MSVKPSRGEVWDIDLDPVEGHEQAGRRPCLVISDDGLNHGAAGLAIVVPLTRTRKPTPFHVLLSPPEGGVVSDSYIMCDQVRTVSTTRLVRMRGSVGSSTIGAVEYRLKVLLGIE